jgi:hypothetical protein
MANSVITVTVDRSRSWHDGKRLHINGTLAIAAGDYVTGGNTVSFGSQPDIKAPAGRGPDEFHVNVTDPANFYKARPIRGSSLTNSKLGFSAAAGQVAGGAMPAEIVASTYNFTAIFRMR